MKKINSLIVVVGLLAVGECFSMQGGKNFKKILQEKPAICDALKKRSVAGVQKVVISGKGLIFLNTSSVNRLMGLYKKDHLICEAVLFSGDTVTTVARKDYGALGWDLWQKSEPHNFVPLSDYQAYLEGKDPVVAKPSPLPGEEKKKNDGKKSVPEQEQPKPQIKVETVASPVKPANKSASKWQPLIYVLEAGAAIGVCALVYKIYTKYTATLNGPLASEDYDEKVVWGDEEDAVEIEEETDQSK